MRLRDMLKICLVFWESELQYAYKRHAYKKTCISSSYRKSTMSKPYGRFLKFEKYLLFPFHCIECEKLV